MSAAPSLLIAAAFIVLLKAWQGWRLGLVRQAVGLGALAVAAACGYLGGGAAGTLLGAVAPYPERVLAVLGGIALGGVVYLGITIISTILFKKTSEQGLSLVRVGYGLGGAALGAFYGLMLVGAFAMGLRLLGAVAVTKLAVEKNAQLAGGNPRPPDALTEHLAAIRKSLEAGPVGAVLRRLDPMPGRTYTTLTKLTTLVSNSRSIARLAGSADLRPIMDHPKIVALLSDPEVSKALAERRYLELLSNPRLVAAADDPDVATRLRAIDFDKAFDSALRKQEPAR